MYTKSCLPTSLDWNTDYTFQPHTSPDQMQTMYPSFHHQTKIIKTVVEGRFGAIVTEVEEEDPVLTMCPISPHLEKFEATVTKV